MSTAFLQQVWNTYASSCETNRERKYISYSSQSVCRLKWFHIYSAFSLRLVVLGFAFCFFRTFLQFILLLCFCVSSALPITSVADLPNVLQHLTHTCTQLSSILINIGSNVVRSWVKLCPIGGQHLYNLGSARGIGWLSAGTGCCCQQQPSQPLLLQAECR